jgi:hypothetical protein
MVERTIGRKSFLSRSGSTCLYGKERGGGSPLLEGGHLDPLSSTASECHGEKKIWEEGENPPGIYRNAFFGVRQFALHTKITQKWRAHQEEFIKFDEMSSNF